VNYTQRFLQLFEEHVDELFGHALRKLGKREYATEMTRRMFEAVWTKAAHGISASLDDCFKVLDELIYRDFSGTRKTS